MHLFRWLLISVLILSIVVHWGESCGRRKKRRRGQLGQLQCTDAVQCLLGKDVKESDYSGGPDTPGECSQLRCNLDDNPSCCWNNAVPQADQFNFARGTGQADPAKLETNFGTSQQPSGSYFITASDTAGTADQSAQLYSCPISCSQGDITVKLKHWQTKGTRIQVCQEQDPAGPPQNCQDLSPQSGQVDQATVPGGQNVRVVIQAKGFTSATGDVALVDDIDIECQPCVVTSAPTPPVTGTSGPTATPAPEAPCKDIVCNFEQGNTCKWKAGGQAADRWAVHQEVYQNRLTGVRKHSQDGANFASAYTKKKGEKSTLSTNTNFRQPYVIKYLHYTAAEGVVLKACCNDESSCPKKTSKDIKKEDYKHWKEDGVTCPADTKKVIFVCENEEGTSEGACGVDNIRLYNDCGGDAKSCSQSAC